jgi:hypothetical protein
MSVMLAGPRGSLLSHGIHEPTQSGPIESSVRADARAQIEPMRLYPLDCLADVFNHGATSTEKSQRLAEQMQQTLTFGFAMRRDCQYQVI